MRETHTGNPIDERCKAAGISRHDLRRGVFALQSPGALPPGWSKLPHSGELVRRAQEKPGRLPALAGGKGAGMPN